MNLKKQAQQIIEHVGGQDNIQAATHCVTRLRLSLYDESKVNQEELEKLEAVKGSFSTNGQFQVVIGQGTVDKVYKEMVGLGVGEASKDDVKQASSEKMNPLQKAIKTLADIFIPILPAIVTAGLLMGIHNILAQSGIFYEDQSLIEVHTQWADLASIINLIANTAFVFLPGLIGWSAVKKFGGNPLLGIVLGLMLVHPDLLNAWDYGNAVKEGRVPTWNLLGLEVEKIGYQGQVLPVLLASYVLAKIDVFLRNRIPDSIQLLIVGPVALLVTGFLTFIAIGPLMFALGNTITDGLVWTFDQFAAVGGLLYGALYPLLVVTGMHHTFLAVDVQLIGSTGSTFLWPILALSNISQGSAAFGVWLASKNENLKGLSVSSGVSAWLGITEPALFGVNLRYKFPFIAALVSSAIAGMYITIQSVRANSIGVGGVPGIVSIQNQDWISFIIGMAIVIIVPFVVTYLLAKRKKI
ncbi:PTS system trehalose-specific EIIBC component [Pontibacillus salipaludis]|uniref:PTS system trehalose-specific EIIBC component n=1 Tax=Pontibacillus salipaludis TaxID=1697394 RepID=A0ABQ1PZM5_9BACI|nr:PTS system trehalose-specific EIIBC component [Pontibacillus salipaludis]GGD07486.1 PTS system trehalose-specific EIIBC component [Pontibacillus salipaludis]